MLAVPVIQLRRWTPQRVGAYHSNTPLKSITRGQRLGAQGLAFQEFVIRGPVRAEGAAAEGAPIANFAGALQCSLGLVTSKTHGG